MDATDGVTVSAPLVLCYHAVSESWDAPLSVTPARLEEQVAVLARRGYRGVTFREAVAGGSERTVAITFDDAYRSVHELAHPILSAYGMLGTVFVPTVFAGRGQPMSWPGIDRWLGTEHEPELMPMTWDELGQLRDRGWETGSHTRTHPRLTKLGDAELQAELRGSLEECEARLGAPCRSLAFPFGDHDDRVEDAAGRAGYLAAAALLPDLDGRRRPLAYPRVGVYHDDYLLRFRAKISPISSLVRRLRGLTGRLPSRAS